MSTDITLTFSSNELVIMEKALRLVSYYIMNDEFKANEVKKEINECYVPLSLLTSSHSKISNELVNGIQGREQNIAKKEN